jgi:hypothetical protein
VTQAHDGSTALVPDDIVIKMLLAELRKPTEKVRLRACTVPHPHCLPAARVCDMCIHPSPPSMRTRPAPSRLCATGVRRVRRRSLPRPPPLRAYVTRACIPTHLPVYASRM